MNFQELPEPDPTEDRGADIKVFGLGGGGCNALEQMIAAKIRGVEFKVINTDLQALAKYDSENVIELGSNLTRGLGAGADPSVGRAAAEESSERIIEAIGKADMLFLTAGMGGGTGTGAIPVVAKIARELGVLTVAVVTEPFAFEGVRRQGVAEKGMEELASNADSMIVVPNENLLTYLGPDISLVEAFSAANDIVTNAVQSIADLITTTGLINVDFADVKSVMSEMGHAIMSTGTGMGENRARDAAIAAIESPLLNNVNLKEARGILANITVSSDLSMGEFQVVGDVIRSIAADNANVVIGTVLDDEVNYEMQVTVVATGLKPPSKEEQKEAEAAKKKRLAVGSASPAQTAKPAQPGNDANAGDAPVDKTKAGQVQEGQVSDKSAVAQSSGTPESGTGTATNSPAPAPATAAPAKPAPVCVICGNKTDAHKPKCPLYVGSDGQSAEDKAQGAADDDGKQNKAEGAKKAGGSANGKSAGSTDKSSNSKKLSIAGLVAGVVALGSIFYYVSSKEEFTNKDSFVESSQIGAAHDKEPGSSDKVKVSSKFLSNPLPYVIHPVAPDESVTSEEPVTIEELNNAEESAPDEVLNSSGELNVLEELNLLEQLNIIEKLDIPEEPAAREEVVTPEVPTAPEARATPGDKAQ